LGLGLGLLLDQSVCGVPYESVVLSNALIGISLGHEYEVHR
jgi:hypothetical protein